MTEEEQNSDLYSQNMVSIQLAYQNAVLNNQTPEGGFIVLMADLDVSLTRNIMKHLWCFKVPLPQRKTPELVDAELDSHRHMLEEQGKLPLSIAVVPHRVIYAFMRELTQSEQMVQVSVGHGKSLISRMEQSPKPGHFHTLMIGRTEQEGGVVTLLVDTPID